MPQRAHCDGHTLAAEALANTRETLEIMKGIWTNDLFAHHGELPLGEPRVPVSETMDDLRRLDEEIMPKVETM